MRKLLLLLLVVTVVVTGANLHLTNVIETQRDMYARDTGLAYEAGIKHGIEQAVDSSPDVEALAILFARYPAIQDAEYYARCVVLSSARHRVPMVILAGLVMQESSGKADARSSCGAVGLTQIRWKYWGKMLQEAGIATCEADLLDPETSIEAGASHPRCFVSHTITLKLGKIGWLPLSMLPQTQVPIKR